MVRRRAHIQMECVIGKPCTGSEPTATDDMRSLGINFHGPQESIDAGRTNGKHYFRLTTGSGWKTMIQLDENGAGKSPWQVDYRLQLSFSVPMTSFLSVLTRFAPAFLCCRRNKWRSFASRMLLFLPKSVNRPDITLCTVERNLFTARWVIMYSCKWKSNCSSPRKNKIESYKRK